MLSLRPGSGRERLMYIHEQITTGLRLVSKSKLIIIR